MVVTTWYTAGKNLGFEIVTTLLQGCTHIVKLLCIHNVLTSTLHSSDNCNNYISSIEQINTVYLKEVFMNVQHRLLPHADNQETYGRTNVVQPKIKTK